ncbi:MAG: MFS transporter [Candidatus Thorarchaeota archaeon]
MLTLLNKTAYSMGRFGSTALLAFTDLIAFYVYGRFFTISWILSGFALSISYIVIGLTHWLTGYYSDHTESQFGRRKPYVILGAPGLAISCFLLFIPNWFINTADPTFQPVVFLYYLAALCLMKFFYATLLTAYQAWMPEITDPEERPAISAMQNTANWIALGTGISLAFFIPQLFAPGPPPGLTSLGLTVLFLLCFATIIVYLPSILIIRERPDFVRSERSLLSETGFILGNRNYVGWFIAIGFLSFAFTAITSVVVAFSREVLMLETIEDFALPAAALVISILVFLFIWTKLIGKTGKRKATIIAMVILGILLFCVPLIATLVNTISPVLLGVIFFVPLAACMSVYYLVSYVVTADIAHVDHIETREGRAGIYEGFKGIPFNFFQAFSVLMLGVILDYSVNTTGNEIMGLIWWGPIYAPFLFLGALALRYIDIDPDFDALKKQYPEKVPKKTTGTTKKKTAKKTPAKKVAKKKSKKKSDE